MRRDCIHLPARIMLCLHSTFQLACARAHHVCTLIVCTRFFVPSCSSMFYVTDWRSPISEMRWNKTLETKCEQWTAHSSKDAHFSCQETCWNAATETMQTMNSERDHSCSRKQPHVPISSHIQPWPELTHCLKYHGDVTKWVRIEPRNAIPIVIVKCDAIVLRKVTYRETFPVCLCVNAYEN